LRGAERRSNLDPPSLNGTSNCVSFGAGGRTWE
jgi:hypothetical protein